MCIRDSYEDACGNDLSKDFLFTVRDTFFATTTIPSAITIDMDASCNLFGAEIKAAIEADPGFMLPVDNCEVVDTIYSFNGRDLNCNDPLGLDYCQPEGFNIDVTCSDTYRIEVRTVDCGGNITIDSLDVTIEDNVKPMVTPQDPLADIPVLDNDDDLCAIDSLDVLDQLNALITRSDNCSSTIGMGTTSIDLAGPFDAECGNAHSVMYTVTDFCGNDSTIVYNLSLIHI